MGVRGESHANRWALEHCWPLGYLVAAQVCAACGHEWLAVAPVGTSGLECPDCGFFDPVVEHAAPGDGAWLIGPEAINDMRWPAFEEAVEPRDDETLPPLLFKLLLALANGLSPD